MNLLDKIIRYLDLNSTPDGKITYVEGDATRPIGIGRKLIIHCCNDGGGWGAGFVLALTKLDFNPESIYQAWGSINRRYVMDRLSYSTGKFRLGEVQFCEFHQPTVNVANMIGQVNPNEDGVDEDGNPPIRYEAIRQCLRKVRRWARKNNASVHAPRFGSDLAGGDWNVIEKIIEDELTTWGISVTVYDWVG
jgi:O-acetyl-ADP-ribose deacetylase (regulator of RNase III)